MAVTARTARTAATSSDRAVPAAPPVLINELNECGIVQLNRPRALNALNWDMVRSIYRALQSWETDGDGKKTVVIMKSSSEKAFCAGGDVLSLIAGDPQRAFDFFRDECTLLYLIGTYRVPYVALINGITMGGGVGLSVHGRYRVATEKTVFAMPETRIGLFPDVGASHFLPRMSGELGTYLGLTSSRLKDTDVWSAGIATHYCMSERLADLEGALCTCRNDADVQAALRWHCEPESQRPTDALAAHKPNIDRCFAADTVEEILRNLETDGGDWAARTLSTLHKVSPLSLKVTLRLLRLGRHLSLAECFRLEYSMAVRHFVDSDFKEGVTAILIRKDAPKWRFERVEDVPDDFVERFFVPLQRNENVAEFSV